MHYSHRKPIYNDILQDQPALLHDSQLSLSFELLTKKVSLRLKGVDKELQYMYNCSMSFD